MTRLTEATRQALRERLRAASAPTAQGPLSEFRMSAATLVTRGTGAELEFLCVRRSPQLRFFPGYWALPGGVLDAVDGSPTTGGFEPFLSCAARELFEETGVLLPGLLGPGLGAGARRRLRLGLDQYETAPDSDAGRAATAAWAARVEAAGEPFAGLTPFSWTTTPAFAPRRYRALYVHLELPDGEQPEILPGELSEGDFVAPADLYRKWVEGRLQLVPPLVFLLEAMANCGWRLEPALLAATERSNAVDTGALHAVAPCPGVQLAALPTPTLPPATTTNCYVVGIERRYVVDPATYEPAHRAALIQHLRDSGGIVGVLVTHHHPDHIGSVQEVARAFDVPIMAHPETLSRLPESDLERLPLSEGMRLDLGRCPDGESGWHLEVLHTPGHAPGHLCFLESQLGSLVAGDLASTVSTIVIDPPEGDLSEYVRQLERVAQLGIGVLLPSHGPVAVDGAALLGKFLRHRGQREAKLLAALGELGPCLVEDLLLRVYDDTSVELHGLALGSLRAGLEKLSSEARARCDKAGSWELA